MLLVVLSLATALVAVISLLSSHSTLRKLQSGEADYADLADYTGEFRRDRLLELPGVFADGHNELRIDPALAGQLPRSHFFLEILGDMAALALSLAAASINSAVPGSYVAWLTLLPAGTYEAVSLGWALFKTVRNLDSVLK